MGSVAQTTTGFTWETSVGPNGQWDVCQAGGGDAIAHLVGDNQEVHASLMAAAPELLEACRVARDTLFYEGWSTHPAAVAAFERLGEAIAKTVQP